MRIPQGEESVESRTGRTGGLRSGFIRTRLESNSKLDEIQTKSQPLQCYYGLI